MIRYLIFLAQLSICTLILDSCSIERKIDKLYKKYDVEGSFALLSLSDTSLFLYNKSDYTLRTTPASTFKICNSLIGLETGVIQDENFVIPWDSVVRQIPEWNQNSDLQMAFKNSTVWYYQALARQVGAAQMKFWLDTCNYGNKDTSGKVDWFWLTGGLKISPEEQILFLKKLFLNQLPFSQKSTDIVKKIMIAEQTPKYILRAKTGWGFNQDTDIGWYVGYVEKKDKVYIFSNRIYCKNSDNPLFPKARKEIAFKILKWKKVLP